MGRENDHHLRGRILGRLHFSGQNFLKWSPFSSNPSLENVAMILARGRVLAILVNPCTSAYLQAIQRGKGVILSLILKTGIMTTTQTTIYTGKRRAIGGLFGTSAEAVRIMLRSGEVSMILRQARHTEARSHR